MNIWEKYKKSDNYLQEQGIIQNNNWFWDMYLGDQWKGVKVSTKLPVMNFTKQVIDYKTAAVGQNQMTALFYDGNPNNESIYANLNRFFKSQGKKEDLDTKIFQLLTESGIVGDGILYFGTKDDSRIIPPSSLLLADEQNPDIQSQSYIMIRIRPFKSDVIAKAEKNGVPKEEIHRITGDENPDYLVGNKEDIKHGNDGKVTAVIYFEKKDGVVYMARATEHCVYEPLHPLASTDGDGAPLMGCEYYPIVKLSCQPVPNSARGRGWVQDLIPNQIETNKTYARIAAALKNTAYPRIAYNERAISNAEDLENIGAPIAIEGNAQSVSQAISFLQGAPLAGDVFNYAENLFTTTKQIAGANDAISNISDPSRVSGSALSEIREQATINLKGNVIRLKKLYEDIARIRLDMWQVYYPDGIDVETDNGIEHIDGETLRELKPDILIDVTLRTEATKADTQNLLDTQLDKNRITFSEWVQASDGDGIVPKEKLEKIIERRKAEGRDPETGLPIPEQSVNGEPPQDGSFNLPERTL